MLSTPPLRCGSADFSVLTVDANISFTIGRIPSIRSGPIDLLRASRLCPANTERWCWTWVIQYVRHHRGGKLRGGQRSSGSVGHVMKRMARPIAAVGNSDFASVPNLSDVASQHRDSRKRQSIFGRMVCPDLPTIFSSSCTLTTFCDYFAISGASNIEVRRNTAAATLEAYESKLAVHEQIPTVCIPGLAQGPQSGATQVGNGEGVEVTSCTPEPRLPQEWLAPSPANSAGPGLTAESA